MLWTIIAVLLILWLLGVVALPTVGSLVHLLLVVALIVLIVQLLTGRRTVV
ncbi:MAG: lmo0937 family membrane protein [Candidatus Limnocylindria bacterium]